MSSKLNATAQLAAPLAIIDGTHLIFLPSLELSAMMARGEFIVPAVPLKDVSILIGRRYIAFFDDEVNTTVDDSGEMDEDVIERLQVNASDLIDDMCFIRPIKLSGGRNSALSTVRIWLEQDVGAVSISWSDDNTLYVRMPVIGDSDEMHDIETCDDVHIFGDSNSLLYDYGAASRARDTKQSIDIQNAGSCLVADFLGIGGSEQVLLLPRLDDVLNIVFERENEPDEDMYIRYRNLMKAILSRSFLTDGHGVLHSERMENFDFEIRDDNSVAMTLPSISLGDISADLDKSETLKPKIEPMPSFDDNLPMDVDTDERPKESDKTHEDPPWLKTLEKTVEHRISKKQNEAAQIEKSNQACQQLIDRGREKLHKAIRSGFYNSGNNSSSESLPDPQVVKLRYGMQPRSSMDTSGLSVVMDLEIDVYMPEILHSVKLSEMENLAIHEFHISCLVPINDQSLSRGNSNDAKVSCHQIRTISGLVPTLRLRECVTIMASVFFDNLIMSSSADLTSNSILDLSIQGCWADNATHVQGEQADVQNRQGTVLCVLQLSEQMLYLSASNPSSSNSGRCIHNEIDFKVHALDQELIPRAVYEYREPHTLAIDTSGSSTLQDPALWKDFVISLNKRVGFNSHIDLFWKNGDPRLKLVIFGTNKKEQAGKCNCVFWP
ncbi:hypothetical protein ACHAWO_002841 [Cyclotella atomus]|uniref:Uncharacterized protein n=1 Tax=Cyclotella atomus TaxID=382360 RepID=A0ABD3NUG1_9STRA